MNTQELIAKDLLSIKAVFFRPNEPFTWASGIKSPVYCDNRLTLTAPEVRTKVEEGLMAVIKEHYPEVLTVRPEACAEFVRANSDHGGADVVLEVAGAEDTFSLAWECARPNAVVTVVALYDKAQTLPLPDMYGKNLIFKTGGVDGCDCDEILSLIAEGKIDTTPLITHKFALKDIEKAYDIFENKLDGVIKIAVEN